MRDQREGHTEGTASEEPSYAPRHDVADGLAGDRSAVRLRLAPAVAFGLKAALLAGLIVPTSTGVEARTAVFDDPVQVLSSSPFGTYCCPPTEV